VAFLGNAAGWDLWTLGRCRTELDGAGRRTQVTLDFRSAEEEGEQVDLGVFETRKVK
jgi:hypothetical protein